MEKEDVNLTEDDSWSQGESTDLSRSQEDSTDQSRSREDLTDQSRSLEEELVSNLTTILLQTQAQLEQKRLQWAEEKRANEPANRLRLACIFILIIYLFLDISLKYLFLNIYSEVRIRKGCSASEAG